MVNLEISLMGIQMWRKDGKYDRLNRPSFIFKCGNRYWSQCGKWHRVDGPAKEYSDGTKQWYYQGKYIACSTQEEFEKLIKLRLLW